MSITTSVSNQANLIWNIAEKLTGAYKPHEYGLVILPLTVIRRFDCILEKTHEALLKEVPKVKGYPEGLREAAYEQITGHAFYNTSNFTFSTLVQNSTQVNKNFENYLNGFSKNIREEILGKFNFSEQLKRLREKELLFSVLQEFANTDLSIATVDNIQMGYLFEELIRRFSESHNEDAGQHYTPREVIELMTEILFIDDVDIKNKTESTKLLYDPACGTGGMLSVAEEYIEKNNLPIRLESFGQELNDETYAICKADILIKSKDGSQADNIRNGNTLSHDQFSGVKFDYILSNPPFGREWKNEKKNIEAEASDPNGRFGAGLPAASDGQLLFLMTAMSKMKSPEDGGCRIAIIHNGSPLFTGDAGSGPSNIRKYILEHDLLDAIVALPNDIFYNTGIATYIWVLSNKKAKKRKGKVQLINANGLFEKRRKALGNKRNDIPQSAIKKILKLYSGFKESDISKIYDNTDFGYTKIVVERPLKDKKGKLVVKNGKKQADTNLRDTENVPLKENIDEYFAREVLPFAPDAWIEKSKSVVGYEIPFTRYFYHYEAPRSSDAIMQEIMTIEKDLDGALSEVFAQ